MTGFDVYGSIVANQRARKVNQMTSAYGFNTHEQLKQLDHDVDTACTHMEMEDVKANFKLTCDESNWDAIVNSMVAHDTFTLQTHSGTYVCVYDGEIHEYFAWITDANFVEIGDVLPSRLLNSYLAYDWVEPNPANGCEYTHHTH